MNKLSSNHPIVPIVQKFTISGMDSVCYQLRLAFPIVHVQDVRKQEGRMIWPRNKRATGRANDVELRRVNPHKTRINTSVVLEAIAHKSTVGDVRYCPRSIDASPCPHPLTSLACAHSYLSLPSSLSLPPTYTPPRAMDKLSPKMLAKVESHVTKAADHPMEDLRNLWASCSRMQTTCNDPLVGRSIPLERVLRQPTRNLFYSCEYRTNLISRLAEADYPETCFLIEVFVEHRGTDTLRVDMLKRVAHQNATNQYGRCRKC